MVEHPSTGQSCDGDGGGDGDGLAAPFVWRLPGSTSTGTTGPSGPVGRDGASAAEGQLPPGIGGKARSLVRLAALGLPTPPAFAVTTALGEAVVAELHGGRPLPRALGSLEDLEALAAIRRGLATVELPARFRSELAAALDVLELDDRATAMAMSRGTAQEPREPEDPAARIPRRAEARYAVRSSSPLEDIHGTLAPGIFRSELGVARGEIEAAVRRVLASAFSPAAWTYLAAHGQPSGAMAVLIHPFVAGDATGSAAFQPGGDPAEPRVAVSRGQLALDPDGQPPPTSAEGAIHAGLRRAAARFGAVELEWVAEGANATFLQMRPFERGQSGQDPRQNTRRDTQPAHQLPTSWRWDAAHNPAPLSAAQIGLVEWVNQACATPFEQTVVDGYLYVRPRGDSGGASGGDLVAGRGAFGRAGFDALVAGTLARIAALGDPPPLEDALAIFTEAYERLFGEIAPTSAQARVELRAELARHFGEHHPEGQPWFWLEGVESAATRRASAARAMARARGGRARGEALARYLEAFGDESPAWDVREPTWREDPARLVRAWAGGDTDDGYPAHAALDAPNPAPPTPTSTTITTTPEAAARAARRADGLARLPPTERTRLSALVAAARLAAAVAEDDDAFYARLQALVRRALLGIGRRLCAGDEPRLGRPEDVFDLPLGLVRTLAAAPDLRSRGAAQAPPVPDLAALARAARLAWERQRGAPPPPEAAGFPPHAPTAPPPQPPQQGPATSPTAPAAPAARPSAGLIRGQPGAPGQAIGRAVHHPSLAPLGTGSVLVATTILPTELPLVAPGGIVTETGSPLGHVAAQARERGIPAVVDVAGALAHIPEGVLVIVDGDRGEVSWRGDDDD
jgi:phosphohistidine swiveling domain-containing protein